MTQTMTQTTTEQRLAELKSLAKAAGATLFRRAQLAAEQVIDLDWVAEEHGGNMRDARDWLEDRFFADLKSLMRLEQIIAIYQAFPFEDHWKRLRYDLRALEVKRRELVIGEKKEREPQPLKPSRADLERTIGEQRETIARLEGRIESLENLLSARRDPVAV